VLWQLSGVRECGKRSKSEPGITMLCIAITQNACNAAVVLLIRVRPACCGRCLRKMQGAHEFVFAWMLDGSCYAASWRIIKHVYSVTGGLSLL